MQVSLTVVPKDSERDSSWVSTGWDRKPANTHTDGWWSRDHGKDSQGLSQEFWNQLAGCPVALMPVPTYAVNGNMRRIGVQAMGYNLQSPQWAGLSPASFSPPPTAAGLAVHANVSIQWLPSPSLSPGVGAQLTPHTEEDGGWPHPLEKALGGSTCWDHTQVPCPGDSARPDRTQLLSVFHENRSHLLCQGSFEWHVLTKQLCMEHKVVLQHHLVAMCGNIKQRKKQNNT